MLNAGLDNYSFEPESGGQTPELLSLEMIEDASSKVGGVRSLDHDDAGAPESSSSCCSVGEYVERFWASLASVCHNHAAAVRYGILLAIAILYNAYFIASVYYAVSTGNGVDWCDGVGLLIVVTAVVYVGLFYFQVVKRFWAKTIARTMRPVMKRVKRITNNR